MSAKILGTTLFSFLFVGIFSVAPTVLADSGTYHVLADIPNFSGVIPDTFKLGDYVVGIFKVGIGLAGVLAVIMLIMAGISYMMSELVGSKEEAKSQMGNAVFGLLLALGAYTILNTINPDILCLRFLGSDCAQGGGQQQQNNGGDNGNNGGNQNNGGGNVTPPPNPNSGCAPGTTSLGMHDTYYQHVLTQSELCALSNLPSGGDASNPGSQYYIEGANGKAIVSASSSASWYALIEAMNADGVTPIATSSFRTNAQQAVLYQERQAYLAYVAHQNGGPYAPYAPYRPPTASPGGSSHQNGSAIDFGGEHHVVEGATCANRAQSPGDPMWDWLHAHAAAEYNLRQLASESWHWDAINDGTRCP